MVNVGFAESIVKELSPVVRAILPKGHRPRTIRVAEVGVRRPAASAPRAVFAAAAHVGRVRDLRPDEVIRDLVQRLVIRGAVHGPLLIAAVRGGDEPGHTVRIDGGEARLQRNPENRICRPPTMDEDLSRSEARAMIGSVSTTSTS
jgi:hypothetical protein